jgi:murein DD-endopeptidase MepM/ murein hydrolase activator NlpD
MIFKRKWKFRRKTYINPKRKEDCYRNNVANVLSLISVIFASAAALISTLGAAWWATDYDERKEDQRIEQLAIDSIAEMSECVTLYVSSPSDWKSSRELVEEKNFSNTYTNNPTPICGSVKSHKAFMAQLLTSPKRLSKAVGRLCHLTHNRLQESVDGYLRAIIPNMGQTKNAQVVERALRHAQFVTVNHKSALDMFLRSVTMMELSCSEELQQLDTPQVEYLAKRVVDKSQARAEGSISFKDVGTIERSKGLGFFTDPITGEIILRTGQNFSAPMGSSIFTVYEGVVKTAGFHPKWGNFIEIYSKSGLLVKYAHLSKIGVEKGSIVKAGDWLGTLGNTGHVTGPTLLVEVSVNGELVDPNRFVDIARLFRPIDRNNH